MIVLERLESGDQGTFGRLILPNLSLFTGELPWRENKSNISCIPKGEYVCRWTLSNKFKRFMYEISPVESRAGIRWHAANLMGDVGMGFKSSLNGCIALGEKIGWLDKQKAVLLSAPALRRFEGIMGGRTFKLEIV